MSVLFLVFYDTGKVTQETWNKHKLPSVMSLFAKGVFSSFIIPRGQMNKLDHEGQLNIQLDYLWQLQWVKIESEE